MADKRLPVLPPDVAAANNLAKRKGLDLNDLEREIARMKKQKRSEHCVKTLQKTTIENDQKPMYVLPPTNLYSMLITFCVYAQQYFKCYERNETTIDVVYEYLKLNPFFKSWRMEHCDFLIHPIILDPLDFALEIDLYSGKTDDQKWDTYFEKIKIYPNLRTPITEKDLDRVDVRLCTRVPGFKTDQMNTFVAVNYFNYSAKHGDKRKFFIKLLDAYRDIYSCPYMEEIRHNNGWGITKFWNEPGVCKNYVDNNSKLWNMGTNPYDVGLCMFGIVEQRGIDGRVAHTQSIGAGSFLQNMRNLPHDVLKLVLRYVPVFSAVDMLTGMTPDPYIPLREYNISIFVKAIKEGKISIIDSLQTNQNYFRYRHTARNIFYSALRYNAEPDIRGHFSVKDWKAMLDRNPKFRSEQVYLNMYSTLMQDDGPLNVNQIRDLFKGKKVGTYWKPQFQEIVLKGIEYATEARDKIFDDILENSRYTTGYPAYMNGLLPGYAEDWYGKDVIQHMPQKTLFTERDAFYLLAHASGKAGQKNIEQLGLMYARFRNSYAYSTRIFALDFYADKLAMNIQHLAVRLATQNNEGQMFGGITEFLGGILNDLKEKIISKISEKVKDVAKDIVKEKVLDAIGTVEKVVSLIAGLVAYLSAEGKICSRAIVLSMATSLGLLSKGTSFLIDHIQQVAQFFFDIYQKVRTKTDEIINKTNQILHEGILPDMDFNIFAGTPQAETTWDFTSLFTVLGSLFSVRTPELAKHQSNIIKDFRGMFGLVRDFKGFVETMFKFIMKSCEALYQWKYGYPYGQEELANFYTRVSKWTHQAMQQLTDPQVVTKMHQDDKTLADIHTIFRDGNDINMAIDDLKLRDRMSAFYSTYRAFNAKFGSSIELLFTSKFKVNCAGVYYHSPPGHGKTVVAKMLCNSYCESKGIEFDEAKHVFNKSPYTEWFDAYAGQMFMILDEKGQKDDAESATMEDASLISCLNEGIYFPPCADVNQINKYPFTSELLIVTSNLPNASVISKIVSKEALYRRMQFWKVFVPETIRKVAPGGIVSFTEEGYHVYNFQQYDPSTLQPIGEVMGYKEHVAVVIQYTKKLQSTSKKLKNILDFVLTEENFVKKISKLPADVQAARLHEYKKYHAALSKQEIDEVRESFELTKTEKELTYELDLQKEKTRVSQLLYNCYVKDLKKVPAYIVDNYEEQLVSTYKAESQKLKDISDRLEIIRGKGEAGNELDITPDQYYNFLMGVYEAKDNRTIAEVLEEAEGRITADNAFPLFLVLTRQSKNLGKFTSGVHLTTYLEWLQHLQRFNSVGGMFAKGFVDVIDAAYDCLRQINLKHNGLVNISQALQRVLIEVKSRFFEPLITNHKMQIEKVKLVMPEVDEQPIPEESALSIFLDLMVLAAPMLGSILGLSLTFTASYKFWKWVQQRHTRSVIEELFENVEVDPNNKSNYYVSGWKEHTDDPSLIFTGQKQSTSSMAEYKYSDPKIPQQNFKNVQAARNGRYKFTNGTAQAAFDYRVIEMVEKIYQQNCVKISIQTPGRRTYAQYALFVEGKFFITAFHAFMDRDDTTVVNFYFPNGNRSCPVNLMNLKVLEEGQDIAIGSLPTKFLPHQFPKITKFFVSKTDRIEDLIGRNVYTYTEQTRVTPLCETYQVARGSVGKVLTPGPVAYEVQGIDVECANSLHVFIPGRSAECGRVYALCEQVNRFLIGIHVMGGQFSFKSQGKELHDYSGIAIVYQESLMKYMSGGITKAKISEMPEDFSFDFGESQARSSFTTNEAIKTIHKDNPTRIVVPDGFPTETILGAVEPDYAVRIPSETGLWKTPIFNYMKDENHPVNVTYPCNLQVMDHDKILRGKNPIIGLDAIEENGLNDKLVPGKKILASTKALNKFCHTDKPRLKRSPDHNMIQEYMLLETKPPRPIYEAIFSLKVALNGVEGVDTFHGMDMSKASAYPNNVIGKTRKSDFFNQFAHEGVLTWEAPPDTRRQILEIFEWAASGSLRDNVMATAFNKDERKDLVDVIEGKARLVNAFPFALLVAQKMFLGAYVKNLRDLGEDSYCVVGFDPNDLDSVTAHVMSILGMAPGEIPEQRSFFDGDEKAMDAHFEENACRRFTEHIEMWYDRYTTPVPFQFEGKVFSARDVIKMRKELVLICFYIKTIYGSLVYEMWTNNSGHVLTYEANSFINKYNIAHSALAANREKRVGITSMEILKRVLSKNGGDDKNVSSPKCWNDWFTPLDLYKHTLDMGFRMTNADKTEITADTKWKRLTETTFLKRQYRFDEMGYPHMALAPKVLYESLCWTRDKHRNVEILKLAMNACVQEAMHHGKEFFNKYVQTLEQACHKAGIHWVSPGSYELHYMSYISHYGSRSEESVVDMSKKYLKIFKGKSQSDIVVTEASPDQSRTTLTAVTDERGLMHGEDYATENTQDVNPYDKSDSTNKSLSRQYVIMRQTWSGSDVQFNKIAQFDPFTLMTTITHIQDMWKDFRYFKCKGIKLQFRLNSTLFDQGSLAICHFPAFLPASASAITTYMQGIYGNPHLICATTNNTIEIVIPYALPMDAIDLSIVNSYAGALGMVMIFVETPLRRVGMATTPSLQLNVMASFIEPDVYGYTLNSGTAKSDDFVIRRGRGQSEQINKSETGMLTGVLEDVSSIGSRLSKVPIIGEYASKISAGSKILSYFTSKLGLDKPTNVKDVTVVTPSFNNGLAYGKGLDNTNPMSFDPAAKVAPLHDFGNRFDEYQKMPGVIGKFTVTGASTVGSTLFSVIVNPQVAYTVGSTIYQTPVGNLVDFFRFWRGPIMFSAHVSCSSMGTFRMQVVHDAGVGQTTLSDIDVGDLVSKIYDIRGDTWINFTIPYIRMMQWCPTISPIDAQETAVEGDNLGKIFFRLYSPLIVAETSGSTTADVVVYMSAGDTFSVQRPKMATPTTLSILPGKGQSGQIGEMSSMWDKFNTNFEPLIPAKNVIPIGDVVGQEVVSWSEYLHRYTYFKNGTAYEVTNPWTIAQTSDERNQFVRIRDFFLQKKGSLRFRMVGINGSTGMIQVGNTTVREFLQDQVYDFNLYQNGAVIENLEQRKGIEFELPFYAMVPFVESQFSNFYGETLPVYIAALPTSATEVTTLISTGDAFSFSIPLPPPTINIPSIGAPKPSRKEASAKRL
jgi:hypothetical protein